MREAVQILLLCVLIPMAGVAREESREERKQRIMRKYMREANVLSQCDWVVPDLSENEAVADSEQFKDVELEFERHEAPMLPPPRIRRPRAQDDDGNWLSEAGAVDEFLEDPYADPFALRTDDDLDEMDRNQSGGRNDILSASKDEQSGGGLSGRQRERYDSRSASTFNVRPQQSLSVNQSRQEQRYNPRSREDLLGRRAADNEDSSFLRKPRYSYETSSDTDLLIPTAPMTPLYDRKKKEDTLKAGQIPFRQIRRPAGRLHRRIAR